MNDYQKSAAALNRIRSFIFEYPPEKEDQADRVLCYLKERKMRDNKNHFKTGPYSGLTRKDLARTRTCETDWY